MDPSLENSSGRESWRGKPIAARLSWQADYIPHPRAMAIVQAVESSSMMTQASGVGEGMLVLGNTGAGKSALVRYILARPGFERSEIATQTLVPAVTVAVPNPCTPKDFARVFLSALGDPFHDRTPARDLTQRVHFLLKAVGTKVIFIDNFHDVPDKRAARGVDHICTWIRDLIDAVPATCVLLGTDSASPVLRGHGQLRRRCSATYSLAYFDAMEPEGAREFAALIRNVEARLPLALGSALLSKDILSKLFVTTAGVFSYIVQLFSKSVALAVEAGREYLVEEDFRLAFLLVHGPVHAKHNPFGISDFSPRQLTKDAEPFADFFKKLK